MNKSYDLRIGLISFTDPRPTAMVSERENYIKTSHYELKYFLKRHNILVIDGNDERRKVVDRF